MIAVLGVALSGIMLIIQRTLWSIVAVSLSLISSTFLLFGTIKQIKLGIMLYLVLEMIKIIEMFIATVIVVVDIIVYKQFTCQCDSHECEDNFCETISIALGTFGSIVVVVSSYFWICVLSFIFKITPPKS